MNIHTPICVCDRAELQDTSVREHLFEYACIAACMCVCENGCARWIPCMHVCVCLCVAGLQDCVEGVCNKCALARGPERYITGGGRAGKVQRGGKGGREKDRLVRKKSGVGGGGGLTGFSWVLLCFPLCKPWSPAACQQAK